MGWKSRFFCDFVKFWPLGWKSGFFCDFVGFWPLKKCSTCFLAPTLLDTVGFEVAPKGRPGGIRASDLQAPSPNCLVVHPLDLHKIPKSKIPKIQNPQNPKNPKSPKSQNPKSKIPQIPKIQNPQNPKSQNPKSPQSKIQNHQNPQNPKIQNPQNPKSKIPKIQHPSFFGRILGILDLGFCIIRKQFFTWGPQRPKFWISAEDFGFWILGILDFGDFRFWILGILDFGFWILDFGDFGFWGRNPKSKIQNPQNPKS